MFDMFLLQPLEGVVEEETGDHKFKVVDLNQTVSYGGKRDVLRELRVARMTPAGRRLLRIKLLYFWGRPEEDDASWLTERGLPAGER
ncbi:MAG TPA: hypothetical protein VFY54_15540 [Rubrobacter sp.]|nr:hypothetical protein [Rubrobacter sp.]